MESSDFSSGFAHDGTLNPRRITTILQIVHRPVLFLIAASATTIACQANSPSESDTANTSATPAIIAGRLVSAISISPTHEIKIYEFEDDTIGVHERYAEGEIGRLNGWDGEDDLMIYVNSALAEANQIETRLNHPSNTGSAPADGTNDGGVQSESEPPLHSMPSAIAISEGDTSIPVRPIINDPQGPFWASDASLWMSSYCSSADGWGNAVAWFTDTWCPTNVRSAQSGSRLSSNFESRGTNANFSGTATHWVDKLSGGQWTRIISQPLSARASSLWLFRTNATFRSGITGDRAHFSLRYRGQAPTTSERPDFPSDFTGWSQSMTDDLQGVATDGSNWYFTNELQIAKWPISASLTSQPTIHSTMPSSWQSTFNHMGDLVYANGRLYVPLEGSQRAIGVFSTNLTPLGYASINQAHAAWLAYNPKDGLFYSSASFDSVSSLSKWKIDVVGTQVTTTPKGSVTLVGNHAPILRIQGGEFSAQGTLYVSGDAADGSGGLFAIDVLTGFVSAKRNVSYSPGGLTGEELEGLTILDLDAGQAPSIQGQIHIILVDNDLTSTDDLYFKHLRANPVSRL